MCIIYIEPGYIRKKAGSRDWPLTAMLLRKLI